MDDNVRREEVFYFMSKIKYYMFLALNPIAPIRCLSKRAIVADCANTVLEKDVPAIKINAKGDYN
jgi:hypothetical protein